MTTSLGITYACARCGVDVGNGAITECSVTSDLDPDNPGQIRVLRLCRDREEDGTKVKGCTRRTFTPTVLAAYLDAQAAIVDDAEPAEQ